MKSEVNYTGSPGCNQRYAFCDPYRMIHGLLHDKIFAIEDFLEDTCLPGVLSLEFYFVRRVMEEFPRSFLRFIENDMCLFLARRQDEAL